MYLRSRTVALIENGSWAPASAGQMRARLEEMKDMTLLKPAVTIRSSLKGDAVAALDELSKALADSLLAN